MNKEQFLNELERYLQKLSQSERQDILLDFEEHFAIGVEKGETEEHIAASLGAPRQIAKEVLSNYNLEEAQPMKRQSDGFRTVLIAVLLVIFNFVIMLGPFMGVVGIIFSGWVTGLVFVVSPFLYLFKALFIPGDVYLFEFFLSIGLTGLGILIGIAMYYITRFAVELTIRYVKFNIRIAKGDY